jgi:osmotically inducible protein OsmC
MSTTHGSAIWSGGIKDGKGAISTKSGALKDYPYGFSSRFEGRPGSNPEELIGAAHAACFTMALSLILGEAKLTAEKMETQADVTLEKQADGFAITSVHLTLNAKIPNADDKTFQECASQGQGWLSGVEAAQYEDHARREVGGLSSYLSPHCGERDQAKYLSSIFR